MDQDFAVGARARRCGRATDVKQTRSAADHVAALAEVKRLWGSKNGTAEGARLDALSSRIDGVEAEQKSIDRHRTHEATQ